MNSLFQDVGYALRQLRKSLDLRLLILLPLIISSRLVAETKGSCPLLLVSGEGDRNAIVISFENAGKLPIRRLEFNCVATHSQPGHYQIHTSRAGICREDNAMFFPATPYEVSYPYPLGVPSPVLVSVKSVTLSDGYVWKPWQRQKCRTLRIVPKSKR
jgi:hypothetical protein